MPLKVTQTRLKDETLIKLEGIIDEHAVLPGDFDSVIRLDMETLTGMNSIGIRQFILWTGKLKALPIILEKCQPIVVRNFNYVLHFHRPNMKVESFYVPYYSESTDERANILYRVGTEYNYGEPVKILQVKDSQGNVMEIDVDSKNYFGFLAK